MTKALIRVMYGGAGVLLLLLVILYIQEIKPAKALNVGFPASVSTTSQWTIGPTVAINPHLGSTTNETYLQCTSRVITTNGESAIRLSMASLSSTTLSGSVGNTQLASTTVAYDAGLYGCGFLSVFAYSTTTITISEYR